jgi:hypothetical protein
VARQLAGSFPLLPGVPAVLDVELALVGAAACEEGDPEPACVELAWRGVPGPAARQAALDRLRSRATGGSAVLEGLEGRTEARLVAEPGTLVPHRLAIEEELTLRVRQPGGDLREIAERTQDRYQFTREVEY